MTRSISALLKLALELVDLALVDFFVVALVALELDDLELDDFFVVALVALELDDFSAVAFEVWDAFAF